MPARLGEGPESGSPPWPGALAVGALLSLLSWLAGPARAADELGLDPCVQRLEQGWRWSELRRDAREPSFSLVAAIDGVLYAGDRDGFWRYDGLTWELIDARGTVSAEPTTWLGEVDGRLVLSTGKFLRPMGGDLPDIPVPEVADSGPGLTRPVRLADGRLIAGLGDSLYELGFDGLRPLSRLPDRPESLRALAETDGGVLWCASSGAGLQHRAQAPRRDRPAAERDAGWEVVPRPPGAGSAEDICLAVSGDGWSLFLPRIFSDRDTGLLWDGSRLRRLGRSDAQGQVSGAEVLPSGRVLVALQHSALLCIDPAGDAAWHDVDLPFSNDDTARSVARLAGGRSAVVDSRGRLFVHDGRSTRWEVYDPSPQISRIVNAIAPASAGGVWVATHEGIGRFDGEQFVDCWRDTGELDLSLAEITAIGEGPDGDLWLGSGSAFTGLLRRDDTGWHLEPEVTGDEFCLHALVTGPDGSTWGLLLAKQDLGAYTRGALVHHTAAGWERYDRLPDGSHLPRAYSLAWSPDGVPHVGHYGGIARLVDGRLEPVPSGGLPPDVSAFCLAFEPDGTLWLGRGRRQAGISQRTPDGVWIHPQDTAHDAVARWAAGGSMTADPEGRVWIAGELGLFLAANHQLVRVATEGVGRMSSFWPVLPAVDGPGLWIGSLGSGLALYRPDDRSPPRSDDLWFDDPAALTADNVVLRWSGADAWGITPRDRLLFSHRIDGQREWSPWSLATSQPAFGIEPGEHRIELRARDEAGNVEADPRVQTFEVPAPPPSVWMSTPLLAAYAIVTAALAALIVARQLRQRERRREAVERERLGENLRELTRRLMTTQEDERRHLARDLHDDLGQLLTLAGLQIDMAEALPEDADRRSQALGKARLSTRKAMDSVRNLAAQIRPTVLDDLGLESALSSTLDDLASSTGLTVRRSLRFERDDLPVDVASHAFRIVNESLTNAVRHAQAEEIRVELNVDDHQLTILVQDDGVGFETAEPSGRHGIGLLSMRERAEALGGRFHVSSDPDQGTTLTVSLPLPPPGPPEDPSPW